MKKTFFILMSAILFASCATSEFEFDCNDYLCEKYYIPTSLPENNPLNGKGWNGYFTTGDKYVLVSSETASSRKEVPDFYDAIDLQKAEAWLRSHPKETKRLAKLSLWWRMEDDEEFKESFMLLAKALGFESTVEKSTLKLYSNYDEWPYSYKISGMTHNKSRVDVLFYRRNFFGAFTTYIHELFHVAGYTHEEREEYVDNSGETYGEVCRCLYDRKYVEPVLRLAVKIATRW